MAAAGTGDLIIDSPDNTNMRARLERGRYSLGRSASNELAFPEDYKLSREHLVFERTEDGWTVRDVGSRNGTKLNGMPMTRATLLAHGDQIAAGHLSIRFDTRGEFTTAKVNEIRFVEQDLEATGQTVSLDLRSALANSTDLGGCPTLQNEHLGALVRAGRELVSQGSLDDLFQLVLDLSVNAAKAGSR
jgi:pSer/pThr/pTyr-binding forkhead associated (FHA) protein